MRVAFFSPLTPKPSGIADYSEALLPHLAVLVDRLDVFIEDYQPAARFAQPNLRIRPYHEFEAEHRAGQYDAVLYQMGNNPFHVYVYDLALRIPGVVVMHEFNLHHLLAAVTVGRGDWHGYMRELEHNAGPEAVIRARQAQSGERQLDYDNIAMNRRLLESSQGAICHSDYVANLVRQIGSDLPLRKIPHGVDAGAADSSHTGSNGGGEENDGRQYEALQRDERKNEARKNLARLTGLAIGDSTPVFGIFGFLKPYKRIREALRAFARVRALHPGIVMILVGEEHPHYPLQSLIEELGLEDAVRILGYVPLDAFVASIAACDICINLRRPTAGETSGSLLRAMALGKPAIVSEIGAFLDLPKDVAVRIPVDDREEDWLFEYMNVLLNDPGLAKAVGERGREYVARECAWPKVASEYVAFLKQCAAVNPKGESPGSLALAQPRVGAFGASSEEIEEYIMGFSHASPQMEEYVLLHRKRLAHTVEITPPGGAGDRILELGCYLHLTPALRKYRGYGEIRGAYYGPAGSTDYRATTSIDDEVFVCPVDIFDAEKDRFPYPDGYFQSVLCCELIEHLALDPMHMISEINRVLAPGGSLILSTPNIASTRSIHAVLHGYHPGLFQSYIKPGDDGSADPRHSREYTPREIAVLMEVAGFHVDLLETGGYGEKQPYAGWIEEILAAHHVSRELRQDIIYCRALKVGAVRDRWPKELYYYA